MLKIAVYGKGGIGKSTVTSNLAAAFASMGKKVIQIGCDPKADSTINLLGGTTPIPVMNYMREYDEDPETIEDISKVGYGGVLCIETGGPTPGLGCAGRGIIATFSLLEDLELFETHQPDVVLYDVLGDVVCGGFAAPIREGYASKVLIVTSGEKMALYAANNINNAVKNFEDRSYAKVYGIVLNHRNVENETEKVTEFADSVGLPIVGEVPRSDEITRCEDRGMTVVEGEPESPAAQAFLNLAKELLENALGTDKAMEVIGRLTASLQVKPFEFVRKADASQLLNFIQDEHPQTIALILSYLPAGQAAQIISALPPDRQADVAMRIATMDRTSPDVIKEVERVLETKLASLVNQEYNVIGGVDAVVEILNTVDRGTEKHIMESMEIEEPELADEIRKKMFVFEDILLLDDRAIQRVLRDVDNSDLAIALKGANEQVQNAIFNNLSKRLASMIKEDMDFMGPVRMKDVEEAQQKIVNIIRKLEDSAEIVISRGGGDEIIV